jgi:hypothetical protein
MTYSNRIFMYGPVSLLLLIAILYSVFWRVEADTMSARLDRANGGEVAPGVSFSFAQKSVGGFPFRLDVLLSGVAFAYRSGGAQISWRSDRLALHRMAYARNQFIFEADGTQSFTWTPQPNSMPETLSVTPETARASAILTAGRLVRFDLDVWRPRGSEKTPRGPEMGFAADRAQFHALARRNNTLDLVMQIDNGSAGPAGIPQTLHASLPLIDCRATLDKAGMFVGLETGTEDVSHAMEQWRNAMGAIDVTSLALNWPDAHAVLRGNLALDGDDRLAGALRGETAGEKSTREIQLQFKNGTITLEGASPSAASRPG